MSGPRLFVAVAEASGDALAAKLVVELRERFPQLRVAGMAGPLLRAQDVEVVARAEEGSVLGLVEAVPAVPRLGRLLGLLEREMVRFEATVCLTVDAPSLLLRLARRARRRRIAALHWVSPQLWAWRPDRIRRVAASVDAMLCLLPFEPALYAGHVRAVFTGHPAAVSGAGARPPEGGAPIVALCPGSRASEIRRLWPVFRQVAAILRRSWPTATFVVARAPTVPRAALTGLDATIVDGLAGVCHASVALVASGTATIELAACGVPMVVAYRVHPLTALAARRWLKLDAVALPNLLAGRRVVPEHLQTLDPERIAADLRTVIDEREQVPRSVIAALEGSTAIARAADEVGAWLGR